MLVRDAGSIDKEPLPRYAVPDQSEPEYEAILEQIQDQRKSMIGSSFYYIRAKEADELCLCRIVPSAGSIFFHEIVDHEKHGISYDDLEDAQRHDTGIFNLPNHYHISILIEKKLRTLLDAD